MGWMKEGMDGLRSFIEWAEVTWAAVIALPASFVGATPGDERRKEGMAVGAGGVLIFSLLQACLSYYPCG